MPICSRLMVFVAVGASLASLAACGADAPRANAPHSALPAATTAPALPEAARVGASNAPAQMNSSSAPARLVIAIVIDQLGSATLLEHLPWLEPRGAIRTALERGAFFERSVYPYSNTLTAPGHVTIHTGAPPSVSGIDGNSAWDEAAQKPVSCTRDARYPVFGRETDGVTAGPARLRVPTVAHALKEQTRGAGKVVSLSVKDRSALLSVGTAADLALWYDSKLGRFTSSSVWGAALPSWVERYQAEHPLAQLLEPWVALTGPEYEKKLGPDAAPGEGDFDGFGISFPHEWDRVTKPWSVLSLTPRMSEYLVELTDAAIAAQGLGQDDVPDLVALSISGTDSVGHIFGPSSWEYVDHLVRADRVLGAWLERLERTLPLAVLITSDHGVAPLPEKNPGRSGRIREDQVEQRIESRLAGRFGEGPWVAKVMAPYVFLSARARSHPKLTELTAAVVEALRREPWLSDAWTLSEVRSWHSASEPLRRSLAVSVAPSTTADIMFVSRPYQVLDLRDPEGRGTNHGSPHEYDREVPVLAWGAGVPRLRQAEPASQLRVAATLAHLLGIQPPATAERLALF